MVLSWAYNAGTNTATLSGAGTTTTLFADLVAADTAGGWGKFTANATGTQIQIGGKIVIGDGTNTATCSDINKQITIISGFLSGGNIVFSIATKSTLTLGEVQNAGTKTTKNGCSIVDLEATNYHYLTSVVGTATVSLYSSSITASGTDKCIIRANTVWNFHANNLGLAQIECKANGDYFNLNGNYIEYGVLTAASCTFNQIRQIGGYSPVRLYSSNSATVRNVYARNCNYAFRADTVSSATNFYLVNHDTDTWVTQWYNANSATVYRQYEFDLQVCDNAESVSQGTVVPIEGADVTLYDKDGNEVFNETSDEDGWIPTQTVSRGYYNQANGNTLQDYGPHFLVVTKDGYEPYMDEYIISEKRTNQISMVIPSVPADLATARPEDVTAGETFFGKTGTQEVGTYIHPTSGGTYQPTPPEKTPMEICQAKLIVNLLQQKKILKQMIKTGEKLT